jgi:alkanesulfonate monooxygenase
MMAFEPIRFHWRMPQGREREFASRALGASRNESGLPDVEQQSAFCRAAEEAGIESVLVDFGYRKPDSILLAAAVGLRALRIKFIIAYRSGLMCPTTFVQQLNTLSGLLGGRVAVNVVAGSSPQEQRYYGDYLAHDERYDRTEEFLDVCNRFWYGSGEVDFKGRYYRVEGGRLSTPFVSPDGARGPELYIAGNSEDAQRVARSQGSCWMRMGDAPARIAAKAGEVLATGRSIGIRMSVVSRATHEESLRAAREIVARSAGPINDRAVEGSFVGTSDSVAIRTTYALADSEWLTPYIWTGLVRTHGAPTMALVGSPDEVAAGLMEFRQAGVTQFILSGWPKVDEMVWFGREIIPRVREREAAAARGVAAAAP